MSFKDHVETFFCDILDLKEKKVNFYREWERKCDDSIGREAMKVIGDAEEKDLERLKTAREEFARTGQWSAVCKYIPERASVFDVIISRVMKSRKDPREDACFSVRIPFDVGLELEERALALFRKYLDMAQTKDERDFLESFISEEMEHLRMLGDLKYYYEDPQGWLMEKGKGGLDGA